MDARITLAGTEVRLLAERALFWPAEETLFVADVHLGKAETFRARAMPVPVGPTGATLARLDALIAACQARRLVILGDLFHDVHALAPGMVETLVAWRVSRADVEVRLVRGNHDTRSGDPPPALGVAMVDPGARLGPFALYHEPYQIGEPPTARPDGFRLCGHVHPVVFVRGRAHQRARLPCFQIDERQAVLPAFGEFTGGFPVQRKAGERVYAIVESGVMPVPDGQTTPGKARPRTQAAVPPPPQTAN